MPKRSKTKSKQCIHVIEGAVLTAAEQIWAQTRASFARAQHATRCMQSSARVPHPNTRLVN